MLVEITGNPKAKMEYVCYQRAIVEHYNIKLVGWTHNQFKSLGEMRNAIGPLQELCDALVDGHCKFVRLAPGEGDRLRKERIVKERDEGG
jgi:hypothetical protein